MPETSPLLHFVEDQLQILALAFMAVVYALKVRWILKFPAGRDRQSRTGSPDTSPAKGALYSLANIAMPWGMASTRQHPFFYAQFVIFHLAVAASIAMSFLIPYWPASISSPGAILALQTIFALGVAVGLYRMYRRVSNPYLRAISTPDDYFSLALLIVWLAVSVAAAPNARQAGETALIAYFLLTAFFLVYVPFSKISHYLYYPFARFYFGRTMGHRGVLPMTRGPRELPARTA